MLIFGRSLKSLSLCPCFSQEDVAMRSEFSDEIGDTIFAVAMAAAIGLGAANLAIQVNKEKAALDANAGSPRLSHLAHPPTPDTRTTDVDKTPPSGLNF
jgi:hypothetical protein